MVVGNFYRADTLSRQVGTYPVGVVGSLEHRAATAREETAAVARGDLPTRL